MKKCLKAYILKSYIKKHEFHKNFKIFKIYIKAIYVLHSTILTVLMCKYRFYSILI